MSWVGVNKMPEFMDFGMEFLMLDELKKGTIIKNINTKKEQEDTVHYDIKHLRALNKAIEKLYSNPNSRKRDFIKVIEKHKTKRDTEITDFIDSIEREEDLFKIVERKKRNGEITVKFKKVDDKDRLNLIKSIAKKLSEKLTPQQREEMLQEQLRRDAGIDDVETLKKIDKDLDTKNPKIEGHRGCYYIKVGDEELFLVK